MEEERLKKCIIIRMVELICSWMKYIDTRIGRLCLTFDQIKDVPDSFLAVDGTEIGHHNRIPLWMFGLLY
ncbi:hypothetical protein [Bacteroides congonensis]